MIQRGLARAVGAAACVASLACKSDSPEARGGRDSATDTSAFRVALLTPGPVSDQSWNGGAYQGLLRIRDSLGASISHVQTKTPADFEENFREYGARGYNLVFGHGFEFQDAAKRVAPDFPRTVYVTTGGNSSQGNVSSVMFNFADAAFLAGMLGASLSKTGVLGAVGGTELPPVKESFVAFEAGAKHVRPNARVLTAYVGNWDDVSAGKEQALAQIGRGADVIFQNADAAGLGVFQAARDRRVYAIGSNADQNHVAPEVTLGSVVIDLPRAYLEVAREVKAGNFQPRVVTFDAKSDVVRLVLNPARSDVITPAIRERLDSVTARIHAGTFTARAP